MKLQHLQTEVESVYCFTAVDKSEAFIPEAHLVCSHPDTKQEQDKADTQSAHIVTFWQSTRAEYHHFEHLFVYCNNLVLYY